MIKAIRHYILHKHLFIFIIIFFQFTGTIFFAYWNTNLIQLKATSSSTDQKIFYFYVDFSLSMFTSIAFGRAFSGGLFNPAVALFRIFRKTQRYPVGIAFLYIFIQQLAGVVGGFMGLYINGVTHAPIMVLLDAKTQVIAFVTEIFGTGILVFCVQIISQKSMTFIEHNRQFYICIPMYFLIGRTYSSKSNGVNPAFGLGFQVAYAVYSKTWQPIAMSYILIFGPFAGAFCAVMLFQYVYRPLYPVKPTEAKLKKLARKKQMNDQKNTQKQLQTIKKPWTLKDIITLQPEPSNDDNFQFTMIKENEYDDEIESIDDQNIEDGQEPRRRKTQKFQLNEDQF